MLASYQPTMNGRSRYFFSPFISSFRTPPPAVDPGRVATRPRGIRLSSSAVTSTTSRPTRFAISAAVSGMRVSWPASQTSSGVKAFFISLISTPEGVRAKPCGSASSAAASRS